MFQTTNQKINGKERNGPGFYMKMGGGMAEIDIWAFPNGPA
jgi:hypothetical protein